MIKTPATMQDRSTLRARLRSIFPAPFGWHARYMLGAYLRDTFLVMSVVLVVALSIDFVSYLGKVIAAVHGEAILRGAVIIAWYAGVRSVDKIAEFLPFAIFFGVFLTEIRHTISKERLIVLISGRAPLQCLAPLIWFALLMVAIELFLIVYLRPAAVMNQSTSHLGEYGEEYDRGQISERKWIIAGNDLIHARINFSAPPRLLDVRIFRNDGDHHLREIVDARSATPTEKEGFWIVEDGQRHLVKPEPSAAGADAQKPSQPIEATVETSFQRALIAVKIDPFWVRYFGIPVKFLPIDVFRRLGEAHFQPDAEYRTWAQARFSIPIVAGGMALLAGSLCLILLAGEIRVPVLLFVGGCGFAAHTLTTLFVLMGDHGWIHPLLAGWLIPALILACPFAVHRLTKRQRSWLRTGESAIVST